MQSEIKRIDWENYRQYLAETVDLNVIPEPHRRQSEELSVLDGGSPPNVNAVVAPMGAGKTVLVDSVRFVLNGEEATSHADADEEPLLNRQVYDNLSVGEAEEGSVTVELVHDETRYLLKRSFQTRKTTDGYEDSVDSLTMRRWDGRNWVGVSEPTTKVNEIFPPMVQRYYMFDNERLDDFFDAGYTDRVEKAINTLSHAEALQNGKDHLETLVDETRRKKNNIAPEVERAEKKLDVAEAEEEAVAKKLKAKESELEEAEERIQTIRSELGSSDSETVQSLLDRRDELDRRREELKEEIDELQVEGDHALVEAASVALAMPAIETARDGLEHLDGLPPRIQRPFLENLLDEGRCFCGCDLSRKEDHREQLERLLVETDTDHGELVEEKYGIEKAAVGGQEAFDGFSTARAEQRDLQTELEEVAAEREETQAKLDRKDLPSSVDALLKDLDEKVDHKGKLKERVGELKTKLEAKEAARKEAERAYDEEVAKQSDNDDLIEKLAFLKAAGDEIERIWNEIRAEVRDHVERRLEEYYNALGWKEETYTVSINEDYTIDVLADGVNKMGSLSAGESETLALAFMAALSEISGFTAPIVIDTPLTRISSEPAEAIAENLPVYLEDHQLTILMIEDEYTEEVREALQPTLANEYRLDYENQVTEVTSYE